MKKTALILIVLAAAGLWFAGSHYVVFSHAGTTTLVKPHFDLTRIVLDTRTWRLPDLVAERDVVLLLLQQRKAQHLPGGQVVMALLGSGEEGLARLSTIAGAGVSSFNELDEKYDVSGKIKVTSATMAGAANDLEQKAREANEKYDIKGKAARAADRLKSALKRN